MCRSEVSPKASHGVVVDMWSDFISYLGFGFCSTKIKKLSCACKKTGQTRCFAAQNTIMWLRTLLSRRTAGDMSRRWVFLNMVPVLQTLSLIILIKKIIKALYYLKNCRPPADACQTRVKDWHHHMLRNDRAVAVWVKPWK